MNLPQEQLLRLPVDGAHTVFVPQEAEPPAKPGPRSATSVMFDGLRPRTAVKGKAQVATSLASC